MDYRVYILDARGHVSSPPWAIECAGDAEALEKAKQYRHKLPVEVWSGDRLIGKLEPDK